MPFTNTDIEGVFLFEPKVFEDSRGEFYEAFRRDQCLADTGFKFNVAQINTSVSQKGVIRGIHFKKFPPGQAKFVSVPKGRIIDVVVDLRKSSETFLQVSAFELSAQNRKSLLIGYGIGHAFLSLEENSKVSYLVDSIFEPELEHSINPVGAGIDWLNLGSPHGIKSLVISEKDRSATSMDKSQHLFFD